MGHLHIGGREGAKCHGLYNLQDTQEWVWCWVYCLPCRAVLDESNQLHAQIQSGLLYHWVLLCGLHLTLPLAWLLPNWMAYIMQVAGCCGEESRADFSLDACRSIASAHWLNSCKTTLLMGHSFTWCLSSLCVDSFNIIIYLQDSSFLIDLHTSLYELICPCFVSALCVSNQSASRSFS